ncbi:hypothetical protein [Burkholderia multivorans]|uniref:hypothetical protein n=1 Tax=Burkholderia multivorans TaxID=87883 RepID=UPI001121AF08|nr:hypothetical protein [Burkholderia multivorans]HEF5153350.1 hypothetical protein [Burkholderia multivorans]HEF5156962.1 hypothetical protein [Burkholderia multivorans]
MEGYLRFGKSHAGRGCSGIKGSCFWDAFGRKVYAYGATRRSTHKKFPFRVDGLASVVQVTLEQGVARRREKV